MATINIPAVDYAGTQLRVSYAARVDGSVADMGADPRVVDHNASYTAEWTAALAAEQAGDPLPDVGAHSHVAADTTDFQAAVDAAVAAYLLANPPTATNSHMEWCEENGSIASNAYEWSYGNGATGTDIGLPVCVRKQLTHICLNADTVGTSVTINARRQGTGGTGSGTIVATSDPFTASSRVYVLPTPQIFEVGEMLICQTGTVVGTWTDVRVGFRFEEL